MLRSESQILRIIGFHGFSEVRFFYGLWGACSWFLNQDFEDLL